MMENTIRFLKVLFRLDGLYSVCYIDYESVGAKMLFYYLFMSLYLFIIIIIIIYFIIYCFVK